MSDIIFADTESIDNEEYKQSPTVPDTHTGVKEDSSSSIDNNTGSIESNHINSDDLAQSCPVTVHENQLQTDKCEQQPVTNTVVVPVESNSKPSDTDHETSASGTTVANIGDIQLANLDKSSIDLFGSDLKLFAETNPIEPSLPQTSLNHGGITSQSSVVDTSAGDTDAPWIVTVSMYWNDLPAIMIKNQPYIRLVDLHKQMLPAKDTGILKKRCQLLGILVENCTEMQRYFLVQYGKAFNSKSTLIVSKLNAQNLISYYVNPTPKVMKMDSEDSIPIKKHFVKKHKDRKHR